MSFCPGDERLVRLLEEQLDRRELADIEQHLERCDHCQETLEELTRERFSLVEWRPWSDANHAPEAGSGSSFDGSAPSFDREPTRRRPRPAPSKRDHPPTLPSASGPEPSPEELPAVEGYEILERLGQGGMGVVYRARQHGLDRLVALKMIRGGPHAAPEHLARFRIEARSVARLRHPNVVQIHDVGQADGLPFVALELLEGGSLEGRVAGTPQPERASAELLVTLAGAIGAAHLVGVVHRDLKSANVLFTADGTPKIADFGLAKRLDEEDGQTQSGQVMGSPSFMAPEQARGKGREVGPPADLYSLGAILYEMLTGRPPFKGPSTMDTLLQVVHDEPVPPSRLRPGLSRDLETICLKCLAKEPHRRYRSAENLADDLRRYLAGSPILARRIGPRERAWKWARRQPAAAALAACALAATVGLASAGLRAREAERSLEKKADALRFRAAVAELDGRRALVEKPLRYDPKELNELLGAIGRNPRLAEERARLGELVEQLGRVREEQARFRQARDHLDAFRHLRREAQLRDTRFVGFGLYGDVEGVREAARGALDQFKAGGAGGEWSPGGLPDALSLEEKAEVEQGRLELLLIWADAVVRPSRGEDPRRQADLALEILDRAARLRAPSRAHHLLRAECLAAKGDEAGAKGERKLAEAIPTTDAFGRVLNGQDLYRRQKWLAAIEEFDKALRLEPGLFRAQLLMAVCQLQVQRTDLAKANLTACLQREPRAICLYLLRGLAYGEEGYRRQKLAREANPKLPALEAEAEAQFDSAEADYRTALALKPDPSAHYALLINRAGLRLRRHHLDDAVADLLQAIGLNPDHVTAYITLGQAYRRQGRAEEAVEQFTKGVRLKPEMAALYRSRALARLDRGKPSLEAREASLLDFTEAIRLERPGSPEGAADRARRGRLLLVSGRPGDALADYEAALRAVPDDPEALLGRVKSLHELKRFDEVVGACDDALARGKPSAELFESRGLARAGREDYSGAIQDYTQALALEPGRPTPLIQRGWAYLVSDAPKLALHDFDEAIRIAPDDPDAYNGRGFARVLHGQYKAAVLDAEESLRHGPSDPRTPYNAARVYVRAAAAATAGGPRRTLGQVELANGYLDRAQALIRQALERLPEDRRGPFWHDVIQADPALAAIRQRPKFSQLAGQYGRQAK